MNRRGRICGPKGPVLRKYAPTGPRSRRTGPTSDDRMATYRTKNAELQVHTKSSQEVVHNPEGQNRHPRTKKNSYSSTGSGPWDHFKIIISWRKHWTGDVGAVYELFSKLKKTRLQQILSVRLYTAGGAIVQWNNWLHGGGVKLLLLSNQFYCYFDQPKDQMRTLIRSWWRGASPAIQSIVSPTARHWLQPSAMSEVRTERLVQINSLSTSQRESWALKYMAKALSCFDGPWMIEISTSDLLFTIAFHIAGIYPFQSAKHGNNAGQLGIWIMRICNVGLFNFSAVSRDTNAFRGQ